jgi:hypothetical protein
VEAENFEILKVREKKTGFWEGKGKKMSMQIRGYKIVDM